MTRIFRFAPHSRRAGATRRQGSAAAPGGRTAYWRIPFSATRRESAPGVPRQADPSAAERPRRAAWVWPGPWAIRTGTNSPRCWRTIAGACRTSSIRCSPHPTPGMSPPRPRSPTSGAIPARVRPTKRRCRRRGSPIRRRHGPGSISSGRRPPARASAPGAVIVLNRVTPLALQCVAASDQPDVALERVLRVLEAVAQRSAYLAMLVEYPSDPVSSGRSCGQEPLDRRSGGAPSAAARRAARPAPTLCAAAPGGSGGRAATRCSPGSTPRIWSSRWSACASSCRATCCAWRRPI